MHYRIYDFKLKMKRKEETLQKLANNTLSLEVRNESLKIYNHDDKQSIN